MNLQRHLSLDLLRGMTIGGMILVNNGRENNYSLLEHSNWNGLTFSDMVFPFFLYILGITTYISLGRNSFFVSFNLIRKLLKRTILLFLIGLMINYAIAVIDDLNMSFHVVRIWGVLQRIAVCYLCVSFLSLYIPHRYIPHLIVGLLIIYAFILLCFNGYQPDDSNVAMKIDKMLFGYSHLYHKTPIDPEGLLGTIPAVAHTLIGFEMGWMISSSNTLRRKALLFCSCGFMLLLAGIALSSILPINKCVWSPSFALVTCGFASIVLAVLMYMVDIKGKKMLLQGFRVFGINSLFCYIFSGVLTVFLGGVGFSDFLYRNILQIVIDVKMSSFIYSSFFVFISYLVCYIFEIAKKSI